MAMPNKVRSGVVPRRRLHVLAVAQRSAHVCRGTCVHNKMRGRRLASTLPQILGIFDMICGIFLCLSGKCAKTLPGHGCVGREGCVLGCAWGDSSGRVGVRSCPLTNRG